MKHPGLIIGIVGTPRSGKSFLARQLAARYNCPCLLEGEESDFPARIVEDIKNNVRSLERMMWFRGNIVKRHLAALKSKQTGCNVVMDTFWLSYKFFLYTLNDDFERSLMEDALYSDEMILGWPDVTIFLKISEDVARRYCELGNRSYDQTEEWLRQCILPINEQYDKFFEKLSQKTNVIKIDRGEKNLDFLNKNDLDFIYQKILETQKEKREAQDDYIRRLAYEKDKAAKKYGDSFTEAIGNLAHDAHDYAINELIGLGRYGEIIAARADLYGNHNGVELGEEIQRFSQKLAIRMIEYRKNLIEGGIKLGKPEYSKY